MVAAKSLPPVPRQDPVLDRLDEIRDGIGRLSRDMAGPVRPRFPLLRMALYGVTGFAGAAVASLQKDGLQKAFGLVTSPEAQSGYTALKFAFQRAAGPAADALNLATHAMQGNYAAAAAGAAGGVVLHYLLRRAFF